MGGASDETPDRVEIFRCRRFWNAMGLTSEAIAVSNGVVVAVGEAADLGERYPRSDTTELPGALAIPGLNDAHAHPGLVGMRAGAIDVSPEEVSSNHQLVEMVRSAATGTSGGWVMASGYDPDAVAEGRRITREELDSAAPATPVVIFDRSCHWGVLNSTAMQSAGIDEGSSSPPGGHYGRSAAGALDGSVWERAFFEVAYDSVAGVSTPVPQPARDEVARGIYEVLTALLAAGYTAVTDALVGPTEVAAYLDLERHGDLPMRVSLLGAAETYGETRALLDEVGGETTLRLAGVKIFVDGAVSGGTCLLREPIAGHQAFEYYTPSELAEIVGSIHHSGERVAAHANGDEAIDRLLTALERLGPGVKARRHRIEHCSVVDASLVARMARLGVVAVPFGNYALFHGAKLLDWYGEDRAQRMFAHRWLLDAGVPVAGSSDFPCGPFDFETALQSCTQRGGGDVVFGPSQAITPDEVLHIYTHGSAYACGAESSTGRLLPGLAADFTVLDCDPRDQCESSLSDVEVLATYVGGVQTTGS